MNLLSVKARLILRIYSDLVNMTVFIKMFNVLALVGMGYVQNTYAQPAAGTTEYIRTRLVEQTTELVPTPMPTLATLPKTLSIDALTAEEIRSLQQGIYDSLPVQTEPKHRPGSAECMQWLYKRNKNQTQLQAIGLNFRLNKSVIKINGKLRRASMDWSIDSDSDQNFFGSYEIPGKRPGGGGVSVYQFKELDSIKQLIDEAESTRLFSIDFDKNKLGADTVSLRLGSRDSVVVSKKELRCTHLAADCRQYTVGINRLLWLRPTVEKDQLNYEIPIDQSASNIAELVIEDMCPFSRNAMVQGALNTRGSGELAGIKRHGIKSFLDIKSMRDVLRPFVKP